MIDSDLLYKAASKPGLCSSEELETVINWLTAFNKDVNLYRSVYGDNIKGYSIDSGLDSLKKSKELLDKYGPVRDE